MKKENNHEHQFRIWNDKEKDWQCRKCSMTKGKYLENLKNAKRK